MRKIEEIANEKFDGDVYKAIQYKFCRKETKELKELSDELTEEEKKYLLHLAFCSIGLTPTLHISEPKLKEGEKNVLTKAMIIRRTMRNEWLANSILVVFFPALLLIVLAACQAWKIFAVVLVLIGIAGAFIKKTWSEQIIRKNEMEEYLIWRKQVDCTKTKSGYDIDIGEIKSYYVVFDCIPYGFARYEVSVSEDLYVQLHQGTECFLVMRAKNTEGDYTIYELVDLYLTSKWRLSDELVVDKEF